MPSKNKNIFFMNYHKLLMPPFVIYADFECITIPIKEEYGNKPFLIKSIRLAVIVTK